LHQTLIIIIIKPRLTRYMSVTKEDESQALVSCNVYDNIQLVCSV